MATPKITCVAVPAGTKHAANLSLNRLRNMAHCEALIFIARRYFLSKRQLESKKQVQFPKKQATNQ